MTAVGPPTPPDSAFAAVAQALDRNTSTLGEVVTLLKRGQGRINFLLIQSIAMTFVIVILVVVVVFTLSTAIATGKLVTAFDNATGPAAQAKQAGTISAAIVNIAKCVESHSDRLSEKNHGLALDPIPKGCPPDSLSAAPAQR